MRFLNHIGLWAGLALVMVVPSPLCAQEDDAGVRFTAGAIEVEVGGRVQTLFTTTSIDSEAPWLWEFRRVRMELAVKVNDVVSGEIQPDFAGGEVSLKDAFLLLHFSPGFELLAGQAHRPFSRIEQTSSTQILPVERGLSIRGVDAVDHYNLISDLGYSDRDIGVQIMGSPEGAPLGFSYAAGVFAGPLQGEVGNEGTYQLAARATLRPVESIGLGVGWSRREFVLRDDAGQVTSKTRPGHAVEVDVEYGSFDPGFHLIGEVAAGETNPFADADFLGAQVWAAYRTPELGAAVAHLEPTFRISYGDPTTGSDPVVPIPSADPVPTGGTLLTPGFNLYFGGRNRVMLNYDLWNPDGGDTEGSFKAMFQLAF